MKLNIPEEYVPLIIRGLEHYYAYTRAALRDDSRYQQAAHWLQRMTAESAVVRKPVRRALAKEIAPRRKSKRSR